MRKRVVDNFINGRCMPIQRSRIELNAAQIAMLIVTKMFIAQTNLYWKRMRRSCSFMLMPMKCT